VAFRAAVLAGRPWQLQLPILRLRTLQEWNIGICVFPERKEILIRSLGFVRVARQSIRPAQAQVSQGPIGSFSTTPG
jgi:hypothetical protein